MRPSAPKASLAHLLKEVLVGLTALACLAALFFVLLRWRVNTPEEHLNFDRAVVNDRPSEQSHD
jgi:hypothetical protein